MAIGILNGQESPLQTVNKKAPDVDGNVEVTLNELGGLSVNGGTMKGPLNVQEPTQGTNAVTLNKAKGLVNGAWRTAKGTLTRGGWSSRWQSISCPGLTTNSRVIASADGNSTNGTRAWKEADVWAALQVSGAVRFYYYEDAPAYDIPVIIFYEVGA